MPVPTKAEIKTEIAGQLTDPSVTAEVKAVLKDLVESSAFDDKAARLSKAWAALQTRTLSGKKTQIVLALLRRV